MDKSRIRYLRQLNSSELFGGLVIGREGWKIGEVKHLVVEPSGWQVKALEVQPFANIAEEFGMKKMLGGTRVSVDVKRVKA